MKNEMYKRILPKDGGRVFVCGDLHGEITKLDEKLTDINFNKEKDIMVSVGDLIDRGEDSVACLRLINEPWFECVRGNHEQMAIDALESKHSMGRSQHWMRNGGGWYYSLSQESVDEVDVIIKSLSSLPHVIEVVVEEFTYVICHADYPIDNYKFGASVDKSNTIWSRSRYNESIRWCYGENIKGADLFIFGHTPVDDVENYGNQVYIDTGAVFKGGKLTVIELLNK